MNQFQFMKRVNDAIATIAFSVKDTHMVSGYSVDVETVIHFIAKGSGEQMSLTFKSLKSIEDYACKS